MPEVHDRDQCYRCPAPPLCLLPLIPWEVRDVVTDPAPRYICHLYLYLLHVTSVNRGPTVNTSESVVFGQPAPRYICQQGSYCTCSMVHLSPWVLLYLLHRISVNMSPTVPAPRYICHQGSYCTCSTVHLSPGVLLYLLHGISVTRGPTVPAPRYICHQGS